MTISCFITVLKKEKGNSRKLCSACSDHLIIINDVTETGSIHGETAMKQFNRDFLSNHLPNEITFRGNKCADNTLSAGFVIRSNHRFLSQKKIYENVHSAMIACLTNRFSNHSTVLDLTAQVPVK